MPAILKNKIQSIAEVVALAKDYAVTDSYTGYEMYTRPNEPKFEALEIHHYTHHMLVKNDFVDTVIARLSTLSVQSDDLNTLLIQPVSHKEDYTLLNVYVGRLKQSR